MGTRTLNLNDITAHNAYIMREQPDYVWAVSDDPVVTTIKRQLT